MRDKLIERWQALTVAERLEVYHSIIHEKNNRITRTNFTGDVLETAHFDLAVDLLQELTKVT